MGTSSSSETLVNAVKDYLNAEKATTVSGHSLGGALATLLTLDVAHNSKLPTPVVYTYASPRVGDYLFKDDYNDTVATSYRMYNSTDAVPDMPLWPYTSVKTGFKLTPDTSKVSTSIACSHHLTTYLWLMGQQAGVDAGALDSDCVVSE